MARTSARSASQPPATSKSVQFALDDPKHSSPDRSHRSRHDRRGYDSDTDSSYDGHRSSRHKSDRRQRPARQDSRTPSPVPSDQTIDLPERFDEEGRPKPETNENPLANTIQEMLGGKGSVGKMLLSLTDGLIGGGNGSGGSGSGSGSGSRSRDDRRRRR